LASELGLKSPTPNGDPVLARLKSFRAVHGRILNGVVLALPYAALALLLGAFIAGADPMFLTGMLAAAVAAFLFQMLLRQIPAVLKALWKRQVFALPDHAPVSNVPISAALLDRLPSWLGSLGARQRLGLPAELTPRYLYYINQFESALNHRFSWMFGVGLSAIMYVSFSIRLYQTSHRWWSHLLDWPLSLVQKGDWSYLAFAASQLLLAFVLGLLLWRMAVAAHKVYQVGDLFDLKLQVTDPDQCAGLKPLGDVCLTNALILTVPAIFMAAWLIAIPAFGDRFTYYVAYYHSLLWIVFALALVAFLQPLYGVHRAMVRGRVKLQGPLDDVDQRIADLTNRLLRDAGTANFEQLDELRKELAARREIYDLNANVAVWPFNRKLLGRFSLAQFIPLLSLTGIGPAFVDTLERVFPR
jgi:hypothetical protein